MKYPLSKMKTTMFFSAKTVHELPVGTVLELVNILEFSSPNNNSDVCIFRTNNGETVKIKVASLAGIHDYDGEFLCRPINEEEVEFANKFTIVSKKDRIDSDGDLVYPLMAFEGVEREFQTQAHTGEELRLLLKENGLKDNHGMQPKQVITFKVDFNI